MSDPYDGIDISSIVEVAKRRIQARNAFYNTGDYKAALDMAADAVHLYEVSYKKYPDKFAVDLAEAFNDFGMILEKDGQHQESLRNLEASIALARVLYTKDKQKFASLLAMSLNNLSVILSGLGERQAAKDALTESVELYRILYANNQTLFAENLSNSLNNLGYSLADLGCRIEALQVTEEAVTLFRELYIENRTKFAASLAKSLNNLGRRREDMGWCEAALRAIEEAVTLYRELYNRNPSAFAGSLAHSLNDLSYQLGDLGQHNKALQVTEEAEALRRALYIKNPAKFSKDLAASLDNLGNRLAQVGRWNEALDASRESVQFYRVLHTHNPSKISIDLAMSLNNLGNRFQNLGRYEAAWQTTEEAVTICRDLYISMPSAFAGDLATCLHNFGSQLRDSGQNEAALKAIEEAVSLYRELYNNNPSAFAGALACSLSALGGVLANLSQRELALHAMQEAVSLYRELYNHNQFAFADTLASSLNNLGILLKDLGWHEEALKTIEEAVDVIRELRTLNPLGLSGELALYLNSLGTILNRLRRYEVALQATEEAVALYRELYSRNPYAFTDCLVMSLNNLGNLHGALERHEVALQATEEAVTLSRGLGNHNPLTFTKYLAISLNNLASRFIHLQRKEDALLATKEAVALYRELYNRNSSIFSDSLASNLSNLAIQLDDLGQHDNAILLYRESADLLTTINENVQWEPFDWLSLIQKCTIALSSPADLRTVHLRALEMLLDMRLSPLYNTEVSQAITSLQAHLIADIWRKLRVATEQDSGLSFDVLPTVVAALQSPDLQRWLIEKGKNSPEAAAVAEAEAAVRRANNEVHLLWQRIRGGGFDNMNGGEGSINLRHRIGISTLVNSKLQEQLKHAEQQAQIARQARHDSRNALAEVDPAFAAAYRALSADDLIELLSELKRSAAPHRASTEAPATLLCLLDIPANGDTPAAIVGMLLTSDGVANRIQAVDFPGLHSLAQDCARYTPIGQRSCEVLRWLESDSISTESTKLSFDELITQLETTWWNPLQQALGESATTLGMLHVCTHGLTHHLPFSAVSTLRSEGNLALFQWPGLPYLRLAHTLKQTRSTTELSATTWPNGLWQIGHDCAWIDRVPLPMAAVEAGLLHRLMQANLGNGFTHTVETVTTPEQLNVQSAGLVLCAHGSGAQADDTHVRMANGQLSTKEVLERGLAPHLVLLPVCHAGQSADDAHGNALGLAAGFLLAGAGVVVGSSKPVPDTYMLWFTSLLLWYVRQGLSAYEAATRARTDFGAGNFPADYRAWVRSELTEALAVLHLGGAEYQGVEQMQAQYQQNCKAAQVAGQPLPHYPLEGIIKDWPWAGFREAALPLATTDEGVRQKALSLVAARAFEDKPNSQTAAIMREMAAFIVVCGLG